MCIKTTATLWEHAEGIGLCWCIDRAGASWSQACFADKSSLCRRFVELVDRVASAVHFNSPSEMLHYALREACYYDHIEVRWLLRVLLPAAEGRVGSEDACAG